MDTLDSVHQLNAHGASVTDFDCRGTILASCGMSTQHGGRIAADRFLVLYDLRTHRAQPPIALSFTPSFVRFIPTYTDRRLVVASAAGEWAVFELGSMCVPQQMATNGYTLTAIDVSHTKQCIAFADDGGVCAPTSTPGACECR
jgi:hypothetical protein